MSRRGPDLPGYGLATEPEEPSRRCVGCHRERTTANGAFCRVCGDFICGHCLPDESEAGATDVICARCDDELETYAREHKAGVA